MAGVLCPCPSCVSPISSVVVEGLGGLNMGSATRGLVLHWEGKRLYRQRMATPRLLEPVSELSLGEDSPNMIIEGDNLQVMASLKSRFAGQVQAVYIDPP